MIICDIDNVLSEDSHRLPLIDWEEPDLTKRFHSYHTASLKDKCHNKHLLGLDVPVVLMTSMPEPYRRVRSLWLRTHSIPYGRLFMRPAGEFCSSVDLKRGWCQRLVDDGYSMDDVIAAYDDRAEVVAMFKEDFGLNAQRVAIHEQHWGKQG